MLTTKILDPKVVPKGNSHNDIKEVKYNDIT